MMVFLYGLLLLTLLTLETLVSAKDKEINNKPIIALIAAISPKGANQSYIPACYIKYFESAGARIVPIPHYYNEKKVEQLFKYVNGVVFPGGSVPWDNAYYGDNYFNKAKHMWNLALKANDNGDYMPIWGACLGFETFHDIRAKKEVLANSVSDDIAHPLNFTKEAKGSKLFRDMPSDLYEAAATEKITYNHHMKGVTPTTYEKNPRLKNFFKPLSMNIDDNGRPYYSIVEAYKYPIYGVQWHPEKNNFEFAEGKNIPHTANAVRLSQYLADFFVNEARKNFHKFPSKKMEKEHLIYNYTPIHSREVFAEVSSMQSFEQCYVFRQGKLVL